jgi:hypothetical protein
MNATFKALRTAGTLIAPAARRSATTGSNQQSSKKMNPILWLVPPALVIFGYGGMVVMGDTGSLHRIMASFGNIPRD